MTTIKSLKDMYVKLGGSLTDTYADIAGGKAVGTYATIPEMIQACTKKAGSGGSGLPDYTAADNGKFLGVVEGEAAWAEAGGGEEPFYVTFTVTNPDGFVVGSADKRFAEIAAADAAGKRIVGKFVATVDGQDVEIFEADVAARMFAEHGNAYVWQNIRMPKIVSIIYDAEGISVNMAPINESDVFHVGYVINDAATSDVSCSQSAADIWNAYDAGKMIRADFTGIGSYHHTNLMLTDANAAASDTYEFVYGGTYLDGTGVKFINVYHHSTGGNDSFNVTVKTLETA